VIREERRHEERSPEERLHADRSHEEHGPREEARASWTYITGPEHTTSAAVGANESKGVRKAGHVYTNDDVSRQNDKNGTVKYDGKTEKL
jgi:sorbitol-specific phosphotransferase system component IIA